MREATRREFQNSPKAKPQMAGHQAIEDGDSSSKKVPYVSHRPVLRKFSVRKYLQCSPYTGAHLVQV